ncbi:MAG TPA: 6-carboxytetrahydropterin synthase [Bacteroidales bacterium]|nr:6-carboxytetrahydropterin synthase [Bacteroidales bacterium]
MTIVIRVTKEFTFEMAHVLWNYDGPCRNVHGHSYRLFVTISGFPSENPENPKNGMVIDFTDLKKIVKMEIVSKFDHAVAVSSRYDQQKIEMFTKMFGNTVLLDYQPTCENLVSDFAARITPNLPSGTKLHSLKLYETATSFAEWYASDNE